MSKKLEALLDYIYNVEYSLTPTETMIVQRERNELKYNLLEAFIEVLVAAGLPKNLVHRTTDGYIFELENEVLGAIPVHIDVKVKNMDYPLYEAIQEWEDKVWEKKRKEEKAQEEKAEKEKREAERKRLQESKKKRVRAEYEEYMKK